MDQSLSNLSADLVDALGWRYGPIWFAETGTNEGTTPEYIAQGWPWFQRIFTVELKLAAYVYAYQRLSRFPHVECFYDDSVRWLSGFCREPIPPTLFWLDSHWCGPGSARGEQECPLLGELAAIGGLEAKAKAGSRQSHVVVIDDARLFTAPPPPPHDAAEWPTLDDIKAVVWHWRPRPPFLRQIGDALVLTPEEFIYDP